jgi:hypothetical protein
MKRKLLNLLVTLALLLAGATVEAFAQDDEGPDTDEHPFEVGAQLTFLGINFPERVVTAPPGTGTSTVLPRDHISVFGFGGRFAYNANQYVALEAEANYFPKRNLNEVFQNRRTQFLAGVRAGRRWEKVGVFAKGRLGAMRFDEYGIRGPCTATPIGSQDCFDDARTFLATDVGGVVEYYPTRRTILRVDAGDTIIRFRDVGPITFPPFGTFGGSSVFTRRETTHNFQMTFGLGFRF